MRTSSFIKLAAVSMGFASFAFASPIDRPLGGSTSATCNCKSAADCTCPRGQCKCKNCGAHQKPQMFDSLKGSSERTRLPDTARHDARGGVFI
ncbi:MAG: hypothetical protein JNJ54_28925 [Myxococcaceae bacterium]|nr:hypothetical protein [Myxococcaceae bacterium]